MEKFSLIISVILLIFNPLKSQNKEKYYGKEFAVLELKDYSDNKDKIPYICAIIQMEFSCP